MCNLFIQNLTARGNGEWGMGNGGFFDSLTIWLDKKIAHRVLLKIFKKENKKCCC